MSPCPTEPELRAFLCGSAPAADQVAVGTHLDECPACLERLSGLDPSADPLVGALRGATPDHTGVLEPAVL